ncbi:MAG: phenylalanine--tRNA ligase subunit beta, partial [Candidatus Competibacterales bacterium]|nr:phenylalanine--tRNA ligase subunit beta [Candidatus Competibacterales bacterium]
IEALLMLTGGIDRCRFVAAAHPALHPGQSGRIERDGETLGWLGALHPRIARERELEGPAFLFELDLERLCRSHLPAPQEPARFPHSRRDLAVLVEESISAEQLLDSIRHHGGEHLRSVVLFDVYRGTGVPEGHKSIACGLILQDLSRNLTDREVDQAVAGIVTGLQQQLGATLRN